MRLSRCDRGSLRDFRTNVPMPSRHFVRVYFCKVARSKLAVGTTIRNIFRLVDCIS
jgi:hypothetical protein